VPKSPHRTPTSLVNAPWSMRSSPPPVAATSTPWPPYCTRRRVASRLRSEPPGCVHGRPRRSRCRQASAPGANPAAQLHPALVNGAAGVVITIERRPHAVMAFTVAEDEVVEIDVIADPERVGRVAAAVLEH
jgi:hypothetical protein